MPTLNKTCLVLLLPILFFFTSCNEQEIDITKKRIKEIELDNTFLTFHYDDDRIIRISTDSNFDFENIFEYDDQGRVIRMITQHDDSIISGQKIISYLDNGEIMMESRLKFERSYLLYHISGNQDQRYIGGFDVCSEDGECTPADSYEHEYDSDGNLLKTSIFNVGATTPREETEFTYDGQFSPLYPYRNTIGFLNVYDGILPIIFNFSRNNITRSRLRNDGRTWTREYQYEYDEDGYPVNVQRVGSSEKYAFYRWEEF